MPRIAVIACVLRESSSRAAQSPARVAWTSHWKSRGKPFASLMLAAIGCPTRSRTSRRLLSRDVRVLTAALSPNMCRPSALPSTKPLRAATSQPRPALPNEAACNAPVENPTGEAENHEERSPLLVSDWGGGFVGYALVIGLPPVLRCLPPPFKRTRRARNPPPPFTREARL